MENNQSAKLGSGGGGTKPITDSNNGGDVENPSPVEQHHDSVDTSSELAQSSPSAADRSLARTPFTNLSQVDADLALARTLQEQERAYMMLRMNTEGSDYGSWEAGSYLPDDEDDFNEFHDETDDDDDDEEEEDDGDEDDDEEEGYDGTDVDAHDAFDVHDHHTDDAEAADTANVDFDPAIFTSDEAYARALQDAEDREMAARLFSLAGLSDRDDDDDEDSDDEGHGGYSQDAWEEVDPDELSYEELLALGDVVGTESRGLSADTIASLPSVDYKTGSSQNGSNDSCVICRMEYEDGDKLTLLSCKHSYHPECLSNWLNINKVCPVCSAEVSTSGNS